ncbi:D-2-hydroxyacid dehydrogenase [Shewanella fodinae]|uniref:D-2-hydroxyacid dehydrogenase n=1 Tax=Shewanella fodinae TaxID=552357 RepID=UPI00167B4E98|nr:D-2-hydroxyacid dehydrogenase [Shewanella fodinae]MCL2905694.1 D-2-hydroxyacid dehydrogenase [Shewanella fodinae]GGY97610.1 glycerate dehydrogenase [Shewanella fodinae]
MTEALKIVVLDGYTLNPGDLSWESLAQLGQLQVYDRTTAADTVARAQGAQILLTNKTVLDAATLKQLPDARYIGVLATGYNVVDLNAAAAQGIVVTNVPAYGPDAVAQMVFAHILHHTQQVASHHAAVARGDWTNSIDFCFTLAPLTSLSGKTLGVVGYGDIGSQVVRIGLALGMKVLLHTRSLRTGLPEGVTQVDLPTLYRQSDVMSLHCPLSDATAGMINKDSLALMKPGAILINTARGGLIDEAALAEALHAGRIRAGVDVLSSEPPKADNPLITAPNISITPHNAWATTEARQKLMDIAIYNVVAYLQGKTQNQVN